MKQLIFILLFLLIGCGLRSGTEKPSPHITQTWEDNILTTSLFYDGVTYYDTRFEMNNSPRENIEWQYNKAFEYYSNYIKE